MKKIQVLLELEISELVNEKFVAEEFLQILQVEGFNIKPNVKVKVLEPTV